jgi:hypothetical protein
VLTRAAADWGCALQVWTLSQGVLLLSGLPAPGLGPPQGRVHHHSRLEAETDSTAGTAAWYPLSLSLSLCVRWRV